MIKYLLMILLALTKTAICDEKEARARKIESATKGKTITFSERAYFSNTSDFSGNKFPFNDKESFKHDYVNLHHPFSTLNSHFRGRFIAKFKVMEKVTASHIDEIIRHFKNKEEGMEPVLYFEIIKLNDHKSNVSGEVRIIGYGWLDTEEKREKSSNREIIKEAYFTDKNFTPLSKDDDKKKKGVSPKLGK